MEHTSHVPDDDDCDADLDPRIQIELEKLNNATDDINKLETELDDANTTFRLLLNESTRRLKFLSKKLGSCIERARPYYEALEVARQAQMECQRAAVQFQRANEIHQAAKETVALAEQRFLSKQHEWQFDNAWQEMLNHATLKVMEAETQKAESGREHQKRATLFNAAEQKVQELEQRLRRSISRSRPYFEEKALCQEQLAAQKSRVENLQKAVTSTKQAYAESLRELERISEEIHFKRAGLGLREPGVGAELASLPVYELELDRCDRRSMGSMSAGDDSEPLDEYEERDLEHLKQSVQALVARPPESGDGVELSWEKELKTSVTLLHQLSVSEGDVPGCENLAPSKNLEVAATHIDNEKPDIRELENLNNSKPDNVQLTSSPKRSVERRKDREDLELSALKLLCNSPKTGSPLHISNRWSETK